MRKRSFTITV